MKILVGVKMVPKPTDMHFAPIINRIDREQGEHQMNAHDRVALDWAVQLATGDDNEVTVFTMGPPQAQTVLESALALGAHRAVHLVDMRFSGADTLATARALARLCTLESPDLVLLGRIATDGGTAQVAPQMAELLGLPLVTEAHVLALEGKQLVVSREGRRSRETLTVSLPAVVTLDGVSGLADGGMDLATVVEAPEPCRTIEVQDVDTLGGDEADYGIRGSVTYVHEIIPVPPRVPGPVTSGAKEGAEQVLALAIGVALGNDLNSQIHDPKSQIWTIAECDVDNGVHRSAFEAIACAATVAPQLGSEIVSLILGKGGDSGAGDLAEAGADKVLVIDSEAPSGRLCDPSHVASVLSQLVEERSPLGVIGPWTRSGREYVPRIAARLGLGCTGDFVGLDISEHRGPGKRDLVWLKPAWDGTVLAHVIARSGIAMGTLRAGAVTPLARHRKRQGSVEHVRIDAEGQPAPPVIQTGSPDVRDAGAAVERSVLVPDDASVVVCCGSRMVPHIDELRKRVEPLGWAVGVTRHAMARGSFAPILEVSRARWALSPSVALVVAPDSAEDLVPLRGARTLITVDGDEHAAALALSDVRITCDPADFVHELLRMAPTVPNAASR